jgi:membrane-associated phospholipid phosphatase
MWVSQWLRDEVIERPDLGTAGYAHNTFPSTHACAGFALIGLGLLLWPKVPGLVTLAVAALLAGLVALGNIAGYAHRPVDVLGSLLLAVTAILLAYAAQLAPWDRATECSPQ